MVGTMAHSPKITLAGCAVGFPFVFAITIEFVCGACVLGVEKHSRTWLHLARLFFCFVVQELKELRHDVVDTIP